MTTFGWSIPLIQRHYKNLFLRIPETMKDCEADLMINRKILRYKRHSSL